MLKIPIVSSRLTDSPYSSSVKEAFILEDEDAVQQLVIELKHAHPSTFLISGYRGIGKTSFINRVREKLDTKVVYVNISLAKYEGYPKLVKKLIRHLHLSFEKSSNASVTELSKLKEDLALLYVKTFYEVFSHDQSVSQKEMTQSHETTFELKKLLPGLLALITGLNLQWKFFEQTWVNIVFFILSLVWAAISSWDIKRTKTKKTSNTEETSRKSLYDDEIAEHHLFNVLQEMKTKNITVVIVLDELDKIKTTEAVEEIINELKALLLSGYANFFIVAGQGLYYQLEKAHSIDNPIISSLFSKTIHVPFMLYSTLKKYCLSLVNDEGIKKEHLLNYFFDTLILEASRIPRKLSNQIRNRLIWEEGQAYINIDNTKLTNYAGESYLLAITTKILDSDLPNITNDAVKIDFFIAHIHLWLNNIKGYQTRFTVADVVKIDSYDLKEYPHSYLRELPSLCVLFFDRLIENNLLKSEPSAIGTELEYFWIPANDSTAPSEKEGNENEETGQEEIALMTTDSTFIIEYIELEKYIRRVYSDLVNNNAANIDTLSIKEMIRQLIEKGMFNDRQINVPFLDNLINTRNKVVHSKPLNNEDTNILQNSSFEIGRIRAELIEGYTFQIVKSYLKNFSVTKEIQSGFDFVAKNETNTIVFEVKYLKKDMSSRDIAGIIDRFTNYLQVTIGNCHVVLVVMHPIGTSSNFHSKFYSALDKSPWTELKERFHLFYTAEYAEKENISKFEQFLEKVLDQVKNLPAVDNFHETNTGKFNGAHQIILDRSEREWPDNYEMQADEIERQENAIKMLLQLKIDDIDHTKYNTIRKNAREHWPDDFVMQLDEIERQIAALRKIR